MGPGATPIVKDLVLIGGGHSHVAVLKRFGMRPVPGVRLTLICRDVLTPYSGMLPGHVAGLYSHDDIHIDLGKLARFAGARFLDDEAVGLDLAARHVLCAGRPPVGYDVLSINIGSTPRRDDVPGAKGHVVPVKPINRFLAHWEALKARVQAAGGKARIAVVGAGAGGVEILLAVRESLAREAGTAEGLDFDLFSATPEILPTHNWGVRRRFARVFKTRGVTVHAPARVAEIAEGRLRTESGTWYAFDEILWVTQAGAAAWPGAAGLATDEGGFIRVAPSLQSVSHANVFAAGDVAAIEGEALPKSGVYAVREGPPLARNLRRALVGRKPLPYRPQRQFLSLITTGGKHAVASRGNWSASGRLVWHWKDWIDRRFMRKYGDLPDMDVARPALARGLADADARAAVSAMAMRCAGCGAKVGATVLANALGSLRPLARPDVLVGLDAPDDAAVVEVPPGKAMVHTVDCFPAMVDDPYLFGRIAANHALGDIYAMGAEPQTALAIVTLPPMLEAKAEEMLTHLLAGAAATLDEAGAALVGGHTIEGPELVLGFSVNGLIERDKLMRKQGLRPGDRLILTKRLGTGTLFAADMRHRAKGRWIEGAVRSMLRSNADAARILLAHEARACTDVTGFGLIGHLVEMVNGAEAAVSVTLDLARIPILDGAAETVEAGIVSSLQPANLRLRRAIANLDEAGRDRRFPLLFDPQTSGGLLAGVPEARAGDCLAALHAAGDADSAIVGTVGEMGDRLEPIVITSSRG